MVEQWNGATNFVFFARRGEMASNRREGSRSQHARATPDPELHGLRQQPDDPESVGATELARKITPRDYAASTPLIWEHVNPYGRFDRDMNARLALL